MLGNDFVNGSCPLGQGRLNKITLIRGAKGTKGPYNYLDSIVLTNAKLLRGINFSASRDYSLLLTDRGGLLDKSGSMFSPEDLELVIYSLDEMDAMKKFIRNSLYSLMLRLDFDHKTIFCDVVYTGDNIEYFTVLDKWSITLTRTSMYYTITKYDILNDYDFLFGNLFTKSIPNSGDIQADIQMFAGFYAYDGITIEQTYDLDDLLDQNFNSLFLPISYSGGSRREFLYSSIINDYYMLTKEFIEIGTTDVSGYRDFSRKGYMTLGQGVVTLSIDGFSPNLGEDEFLWVYVYEYYYNI